MRRPLVRVPVPPGPEGAARLTLALASALDGSGPAIAPIPTVSTSVSSDYVSSMLAAARPDDPALPLESDEVAVVMTTSGSTGAPRGVLLTAAQLTSMTALVNGDAAPQWIAALPVTSMGGFNVLIRSMATGREAIALASIGGATPFSPADFREAVARASADSDDVRVALVPAQLSRLLTDESAVGALQQCSAVLVGGAAIRPSLLATAEALGISVTTTYGATETAGGCVFDGVPLPGVTVVADGSPGRLTIAGPCVALGYRGEEELTREVFSERGFQTHDLGIVDDDGRVTVVGRSDDIVVIRGVNVSPPAIEGAIEDLADVASAAVITTTGRDGEPLVHAFVVTRESAPDTAQSISDAVVRRLGQAARPGRIHRVGQLPHLPTGKVDRLLLQQWAETDGGTD